MRHRVAGRQLSRNTSHRVSLRRNMAASLFEHGAIRTTAPKAKELRRFVEHLITIAKKGTLHARRQVISLMRDRMMVDEDGNFQDKTVVGKLFDEIAPKYADRQGGYTRIIRLADRRIGDAGSQVLLQLVEDTKAEPASEEAGKGKKSKAPKAKKAAKAEDKKD